MSKKCASNREKKKKNTLRKGINVRKRMACIENHKQFETAKNITIKM